MKSEKQTIIRFVLATVGVKLLALTALTQPTPPPGGVTADTPQKTDAGETFTLAKSWAIRRAPQIVVLTPPEPDAYVAIVSLPAAADSRDAAAKAWAVYKPTANPAVRIATPAAPRNGWEERVSVDYETSPNDKRTLSAEAMRKGTGWTVLIVDSPNAVAEKRGAAIRLLFNSVRPAGYSRESFARKTAHPLDETRIQALKDFLTTAMRELGVPGAGVALYDRGKVVWEGGLGVKELHKPDPVGAHTLFMIASNTKGMTTLLLSKLVDEGKLSWDDPVIKLYPSFRLGSDATTPKVLIRHLVCACTGLPRKDLEWLFNSPAGVKAESTTFMELAASEPTSGFGEVFQYNNSMASAGGFVAGHVAFPDLPLGEAYDRAMREKIFEPLGMQETTFHMQQALDRDHASPHIMNLDGVQTVVGQEINTLVGPVSPSGGAWSSAHDMIAYVANELRDGRLPDGRQWMSADNLLMRRKPGVPRGEDEWYGMGLLVDKTWGVTVIHHGGSLKGYKSDWVAIPEAGVGAVLLTNANEGRQLLSPFMRRLLEVLYDGNPEAAGEVTAAAARLRTEMATYRRKLSIPIDPKAAQDLAAAYSSPELGPLKVSKSGPDVTFEFVAWSSPVASRLESDGTTTYVTAKPNVLGFEFTAGIQDGKKVLIIRDGQHEYPFTETGR
jgi:CubicO group peptidase (beta-lactamase class C family)